MNFCSHCGAPVLLRIPEGDNRMRYCCDACGTIHYHNPRIVVGTIPVWEDKVLLCKRAIQPRAGYWTLCAGFLENGEETTQGALRETDEEAGARVELGPLFSMLDVLHVHQVHIFYRARLLDLDFAPGPESLEVKLCREDEIPWDDLAFHTVATTLRLFFADRAKGAYGVHTGAIHLRPRGEGGLSPAASITTSSLTLQN